MDERDERGSGSLGNRQSDRMGIDAGVTVYALY